MMQRKGVWFLLVTCLLLFIQGNAQIKEKVISGYVKDYFNNPIYKAEVQLKELGVGVLTNEKGYFSIKHKSTSLVTVMVTYMGFKSHIQQIEKTDVRTQLEVILKEDIVSLNEVMLSGQSKITETKAMAYNVDVVDAKALHGTTLDVGHALAKVSGVRIRESGGVGSRMNFSLNGFTGRQVKFFMDGIPMDNFGSSFQINNIPIGIADRIEVYKGVVPVWLGGDALGGAINIVTSTSRKNSLDMSYAYGSFNTHRTSVNTTHIDKSGFMTKISAFQNYSDNDYWVNVDVADINTGKYYPNQRVKRFHDKYHNETFIADFGVVNKPYADKLLLGVTLGQNYSEIQTGARLVGVFGDWHRKGNIIMPSLKYQKKNFFTGGLDITLNANYNFGEEQNIDVKHRRYNWFGQYKEYDGPGGERSYSMYKYKNNNGLVSANMSYAINDVHKLALSHLVNTFSRTGSDELYPEEDVYEQPRKTFKNVTGLGYQIEKHKWNSSLFVKNYRQTNTFSQTYNPSGSYGDLAYKTQKNSFNLIGYGVASTYFLHENLQLKASFEKSYRLPETEELYGDLVNLRGNIELDPETSYNYNLGATYWSDLSKSNTVNISSNVFYRNAKDFIRPRLDNNQAMQVMDNIANVTNLGLDLEVRYSYLNSLNAGFNITYQELRNNTRFEDGQTTESIVYRDRIPNMPYLFGNADVSYSFNSPIHKKHNMSIAYNLLYVHEFYLYWPSLGSNKLNIPKQLSQDLRVTYSFGKKSNYQLTLECRNILDKKLYDNFSLQKPGRSFTGKIKYTFK